MSRSTAQRTITSTTSTAATGTAAVAASARQAIATVAAASSAKTVERQRIVPAREHQQARGEQIGAERRRGHAVDPAGRGVRPEQQAGDDQRCGEREADDDVEGMRAERVDAGDADAGQASTARRSTIAVIASQRHIRMRASAKAAAVTTAR